ncbi:MAG TPA: hypothetical protein VGH65_06000 [Verrucomicrobiaceae bacterium]
MKSTLLLLISALLFGATSLPAQNAAMEKRLARGLKLFPDADTNHDGKLSLEEAMAYLELHPDLKSLLAEVPGQPADSSSTAPAKPLSSDPAAGPRVFVCAHSFMIYTAKLLPPLAEAAKQAYQSAGQQMIGGSRVIQHWNLPDDKNKAKAALREGNVDVLTLSPHLQLPDEGIDNFTKLGLEKNPKLRVLVQASWPARDGHEEKGFANENRDDATVESLRQMQESYRKSWLQPLEAQVRQLNQSIGHDAVVIVPVSEAILELRVKLAEGKAPGLTKQSALFRDPLGHPQAALAALVTYCHFAAIFGHSPEGLPVPSELKSSPQAEELNHLLQKLAWDAVSHYPMSGVKSSSTEAAAAQ